MTGAFRLTGSIVIVDKNPGYLDTSLEEVLENLKTRDHIDSTREHSPLIQTEDAIVIDNSNLTHDEQLELMKSYILN